MDHPPSLAVGEGARPSAEHSDAQRLWPARNVAEYAYCPRLFYYMEVEGIHRPSHDTEEGHRVHRRVDAPSSEAVRDAAADTERPASVRSLTLTSDSLALTATLDLAEVQGQTAVPVEFRKGRPRRIRDDDEHDVDDKRPLPAGEGRGEGADVEPWPTDRIQVGLQAILLEEAGYTVPHAILYYAAEKRRVVVPVDDALRQDALDTLAAARAAAQGPRPLPLVNDPRCPRCSLQPICLPDEVNLARSVPDSESVPDAAGIRDAGIKRRKLWPPRDDGIHLVAQQSATKIGVRGASMRITDRDGRKLKDVPLAGVESLSLVGNVQISTQALGTLADRSIPVAFLSAAGRMVAMLDPLDSVSAEVRRAQVRRFDDPTACLELSRTLITAKILNQRKLLMRNWNDSNVEDSLRESHTRARRGSPDPAETPDRRSPASADSTVPEEPPRSEHLPRPPRTLNLLADQLRAEADKARQAASIESIRGHEGQAAALYFENFARMIKGELADQFHAHGRQRRPAPDPVNACLSFAYTMLTHECTAALRTARLEPSIGAFHVSRPGRPALALDLMEPFRPLIADSIAITAFNRGELKPGHFLRTAAGCAFTDHGRKAFFAVYGRRMDEEITHPFFGYKLSYRRMLILHARMIAAWLAGEVPTLEFLTTR